MKRTVRKKAQVLTICTAAIIAALCACAVPKSSVEETPPEATPVPVEASSPAPTLLPSPTPAATATPSPTPEPMPLYLSYRDKARDAMQSKDYDWAIEMYSSACNSAINDESCPQEVLQETALETMALYEKQRMPVEALAILRIAAAHMDDEATLKKEASRIVNKHYEAERPELPAYVEKVKALAKKHGYATKSIGEGSLPDYPLGVFHAEMLDMNQDDTMELICFYGKTVSKTRYDFDADNKRYKEKYTEDLPYVVLYTYKKGEVVELLHEAIGYFAGQSDEGKAAYIFKDKESTLWLSFHLDEHNYTDTYYTVQKGYLRSYIMRAYLSEYGMDISDSIYDEATKFEINGSKVKKSEFREKEEELSRFFYREDDRNVYKRIDIFVDGEWYVRECTEYIKAFVQLYSGKKGL